MPAPAAGEVLIRNRLLSIDPANRAWMNGATYRAQLTGGSVMDGFALGEVVESRDERHQPGDIVEGSLGWQDFAVKPGSELVQRDKGLALETQIGLLGITGLTAYHGMLDVARIRAGETVLVSSAAGAVGSVAGQIARLSGCRVIGIAGGHEKCDWLVEELGFDGAIDYKQGNVRRALKALCPEGIDAYFDNTGGEALDAALSLMNTFGRVACCGNVSQYNVARTGSGPPGVPGFLVTKRIRMEGFLFGDFKASREKAESMLRRWAAANELKGVVDIEEGLENAPAALIRMFDGRSRGKLCVRISP
jgi:NADPH-dependent curcumin reductase CurA